MTTRNIRGAPAAILTLSLLAMSLAPRQAAAASDDPVDEGWRKVVSFAHCALNVFRAVTPADWTLAFVDCGRLYLEEAPFPGGGKP